MMGVSQTGRKVATGEDAGGGDASAKSAARRSETGRQSGSRQESPGMSKKGSPSDNAGTADKKGAKKGAKTASPDSGTGSSDKTDSESTEFSTKQLIKLVIFGVFFTAMIGLYLKTGRKYLSLQYLAENHRNLAVWIEENFQLALGGYVSAMTLCIGMTLPGATALSFAGGEKNDIPFVLQY
jgi:hypothetical protein